MRNSIYTVKVPTVTAIKPSTEEITRITEDKTYKQVIVAVCYKNNEGEVLADENYNINDANYDLLMQATPTYAPSKPANEYREADLWHVIDLIRSAQVW